MRQTSKQSRGGPRRKAPLYRKVNTRTHGVCHGQGGDFRHQRNTKAEGVAEAEGVALGKMRGDHRHGLDHTPLWRFLLSRVGRDWAPVHAEAVPRLRDPDVIDRMVADRREGAQVLMRAGESSYWSMLYVDEDGVLQRIAPDLGIEHIYPLCPCCTHTFNGTVLTNAFPGYPQNWERWAELTERFGAPSDNQ